MTGYGEGHADQDGLAVTVEARSVNNRYLKLSCRLPEGYASLEPQLEAVVRDSVRRGTVQVNVVLRREATEDEYRINSELVKGYFRQLRLVQETLEIDEPIRIETLLQLPGAIKEQTLDSNTAQRDWPAVQKALDAAIAGLLRMRTTEGSAMSEDLRANCTEISKCADAIATRSPVVVEAYQQRLTDKLNKFLQEHDVNVQAADVVREVGVFADRADISEEIVRLRSHLQQFATTMQQEAGAGRQLEFLVQELLRETNTIGSKANDAEIARHVVQIKTCIERMREMVQNIE